MVNDENYQGYRRIIDIKLTETTLEQFTFTKSGKN